MFQHRDHLIGGGHLRDVRRADETGRVGAVHRFRRPQPEARVRRRVHRPDGARTAGTQRLGGDRHPVLHQADTLEAGRDGAGDPLDRHRPARVVAVGPPRRPADAPADPATLAHVHRDRRDRDRRVPGVARHRRQLVRRRLHPRHGPGRRACRLHVELLPLVRQSRGSVRLVLQPAGDDDQRQRRQHLDAAARPGVRNRVLALAVSRSAAQAGACGRGEQARAVGGRPGAAGGVDAVQQRAAARRPDRHRRPDHLRADRTGHHLGPDDAGRTGDR